MGQKSIGIIAIILLFISIIKALDWNSDILANDQLKRLGEQDALHQYYGKFVDDRETFPSLETMKIRVGSLEEVDSSLFVNHNYNEMTLFLKKIALEYPNITYLYSAGKSVEGRDLWVMIISDNPHDHELLEPEVKIVANMHGNEVVGREACIYLIDIFTKNYGKNDWITRYINDTRLHLMLSMNPDGYERGFPGDRMGYSGRENAHGIDLNRNFPAQYPEHIEQSGGKTPEPETIVVMKWLLEYPFVLSMNLHGGSLVANYPWDDSVTGKDGEYTPTRFLLFTNPFLHKSPSIVFIKFQDFSFKICIPPEVNKNVHQKDDVLFVGLAYRYARAHKNMWKTGRRCGLQVDGDTFLNGITNGAGWYHLAGGMQDWQYIHSNSLEVTVEMGCFKFPVNDMLPQLWSDHEYALLSFLEMVHFGVKGIVMDENGHPVANATVAVENGKTMKTTKNGEYWRILAPGDHELTFSAYGLETEQMRLVINGTLVEKNITLSTCGTDEVKKTVLRRGRGEVRIAVIGVSPQAVKILREMALDSCTDEAYLDEKLSLIIIPDGMALKEDRSRIIHDEYPSAVLAVADGLLESVVFSAGEIVPKIFHKEALERSLKTQLSGGTECELSDHKLDDSQVAQLLDQLQVPKAFHVGVGLGCDQNSLTKQGAAVAGILKMLERILTRDAVDEFSVKPSAKPGDHFSSYESMQATSAAIPILENEKGCAKRIDHPVLRITQMGTGLPPFTLISSIEKKTETLIYEMASSFCEGKDQRIKDILSRSTLIFLPEIPQTQLNCHDYGTLVPFENLLAEIVSKIPEIDLAMLFGSGGLKVRYINGTSGISDRLAQKYKSIHPQMNGKSDTCNGIPGERETIRRFEWDDLPWQRIDSILIQTGCCYENGGESKLWGENEDSIVESLLLRTKGLLIHTDAIKDLVSVIDSNGNIKSMNKGSIFLPLENGHHVFRVKKNGEFWADVSVEISDKVPFHIREIGSRGAMNVILISMFSLVLLLICCFIVRGRFVGFFNRKGIFPGGGRGRDGFERIPLYMNDEDDEDSIVDMHKL